MVCSRSSPRISNSGNCPTFCRCSCNEDLPARRTSGRSRRPNGCTTPYGKWLPLVHWETTSRCSLSPSRNGHSSPGKAAHRLRLERDVFPGLRPEPKDVPVWIFHLHLVRPGIVLRLVTNLGSA